jgi:hypothetical protein
VYIGLSHRLLTVRKGYINPYKEEPSLIYSGVDMSKGAPILIYILGVQNSGGKRRWLRRRMERVPSFLLQTKSPQN